MDDFDKFSKKVTALAFVGLALQAGVIGFALWLAYKLVTHFTA